MQRVVAVDKNGNIYSKEDEKTGHNELVYELFEEFLEPLQDEKVKGDFIKIWPNAGLITKYLDMIIYLETVNNEVYDSIICTIPENLSDNQLNHYKENYLDKDAPFLGLYYHDAMFSNVSEEKDRELTAEEVHSFLKDMVKSKTK